MYEGAFENGNLILSPMVGEIFNRIAKKEVKASELCEKLGAIVLGYPAVSPRMPTAFVILKGEHDDNFVARLPADDIRLHAPMLVEIETIGILVPYELLQDSREAPETEKFKKFTHDVFNDVAAGNSNENGYKSLSFVNPAAIDSIDDNGGYRTLRLKAEYGGEIVAETPLSLNDLNKKLGLSVGPHNR